MVSFAIDIVAREITTTHEPSNAFRGVLRGKCGEPQCSCDEYLRSSSAARGVACEACSHAPLKHIELHRTVVTREPNEFRNELLGQCTVELCRCSEYLRPFHGAACEAWACAFEPRCCWWHCQNRENQIMLQQFNRQQKIKNIKRMNENNKGINFSTILNTTRFVKKIDTFYSAWTWARRVAFVIEEAKREDAEFGFVSLCVLQFFF